MIEGIVVIIAIVIIWVMIFQYFKLKQKYFQLLLKDKEFQKYVETLVMQKKDKIECIKEINSRYAIGVHNAKIIVEQYIK